MKEICSGIPVCTEESSVTEMRAGHEEMEKIEAEADRLVSVLRNHGITLACAESCTGGLLAKAITSVPGASDVFWGSIVSYSEKAKTDILGVSRDVLDVFGAVSCETAKAMAAGVMKISEAGVSVSITGFAGPGGGETGKPIGTVWIGLCHRYLSPAENNTEAFHCRFEGNREQIRTAAAAEAIRLLVASCCVGFPSHSPIDRLER